MNGCLRNGVQRRPARAAGVFLVGMLAAFLIGYAVAGPVVLRLVQP